MRKTCNILAISVLAALLSSCATKFTTPIVPPEPLTPQQQNFETLWQGTLDVLRENYFTIDRQDRRAGLITTVPMTGKSWFEFWRHDAATSYDLAESSLQTIYRGVAVRIVATGPQAETFRAEVTVQVLRSDHINMQNQNVALQFGVYSQPSGLMTGQGVAYGPSGAAMTPEQLARARVDLGEDPGLADILQKKIADRAAKYRVQGR